MEAISVRNLCKTFEYYEKEAGLKSSLKNLFHREKLLPDLIHSRNQGNTD